MTKPDDVELCCRLRCQGREKLGSVCVQKTRTTASYMSWRAVRVVLALVHETS